MTEFRPEYAGKQIHELPDGATGYKSRPAEQAMNEMVDGGVVIIEADDFMRGIPQTFSFPKVCNPLDYLQVLDQRQKGACFPAGTMVTMYDGRLMPIEDVKFGHFVRTHLGNVRQVIDTMSRSYTGQMVSLFVKGWGKTDLTADHRVWVDGRQWVKAADIEIGDMVSLQKNDSESRHSIDLVNYLGECTADGDQIALKHSCQFVDRHLQLDELACWVFGLFAAEGSTSCNRGQDRPSRLQFTIHRKETVWAENIEKFFGRHGIEATRKSKGDSKGMEIRVDSALFAQLFDVTVGKLANHKHVPAFLLSCSRQQKMSFLQGYFSGDGSLGIKSDGRRKAVDKQIGGTIVATSVQLQASTASSIMAQQIATMAVDCELKPGRSVGAQKERLPAYHNYLYGDDAAAVMGIELIREGESAVSQSQRAGRDRIFAEQNLQHAQLRKVREVTKYDVDNVPVYDFEVHEDQSFVANGIAVHNCAGFTMAQVASMNFWVASGGKTEEFSGDAMYVLAQEKDGIRGDRGSTPTACAWVAQNIGIVPISAYGPTVESYNQLKPVSGAARQAAADYKLSSIVRLKSYDQIYQFLGGGLGAVQVCSKWKEHFMQSNMVDSFLGPKHNSQHGGGHSYTANGYDENGNILCTNSWNTTVHDEGGFLTTRRFWQELFADQFSFVLGYSNMKTSKAAAPKPRSIPIKAEDWT